jgi:uncharacterized protein YeaO (DUF488 family)
MSILLKRAREVASPKDGVRVLVDRRRPPGYAPKATKEGGAKEALKHQEWLPWLGPSEELRRWFNERPRQWPIFRKRYLAELCAAEAEDALSELHAIAARAKTMTLLTAAKDQEHSHAAILRDLLDGVKKPPSTSGPTRAASSGRIRARRPR